MSIKTYYILILFFMVGCGVEANPVNNHTSDSLRTPNSERSLPSTEPAKTPQVNQDDIQINWQSTVAGNALDWDGRDFFILKDGQKKEGMLSRIAETYCRAEQKGEERDCFCDHSIRLASVVGSIVSIDHESSLSCQGSYLSWRYASFDLAKLGDFRYPTFADFNAGKAIKSVPGKLISLRELFPENEILSALLANEEVSREITRAIQEKRISSPPKTLDDLNDHLVKVDSYLDGFSLLEKDYLTRFAFHHLEGGQIFVWISLTPSSHVGQAVQKHIEIVLPVPEKLRDWLLLAEGKREGFLMKDARSVVGTSYAKFESGALEK